MAVQIIRTRTTADLDALDARPIPAHLPARDRERTMRFYARHDRDTRQDRAGLESDLRLEAWLSARER